MLSQTIPFRVLAGHSLLHVLWAIGEARLHDSRRRADRVLLQCERSGGRPRSFRLAFCEQARRQGAGFDPGAVPLGSHARWIRGPLCPSLARHGGARLRWQRAVEGDRRSSRNAPALFDRTGRLLDRAHWHERDPQNRSGRADQSRRAGEGAYGDFLGRRLRRAWAQVSNVGAGPLPFAPRRGQKRLRDMRRELSARSAAEYAVDARAPQGARE